jgi:hypothetical protein
MRRVLAPIGEAVAFVTADRLQARVANAEHLAVVTV